MPSEIELMNSKILQISGLIRELESEFQRKPPRGERTRIRFPWGTIYTANAYRNYFPFIQNRTLLTNVAYTLQLTDVFLWIINWFDLRGVTREMMIKNAVLLFTCVMEALSYDFVDNYVSERVNKKYKKNLDKLLKFDKITQDQYDEFEKCRCMRDDIHLHRLRRPERERYSLIDYNFALRSVTKMRDIFTKHFQENL